MNSKLFTDFITRNVNAISTIHITVYDNQINFRKFQRYGLLNFFAKLQYIKSKPNEHYYSVIHLTSNRKKLDSQQWERETDKVFESPKFDKIQKFSNNKPAKACLTKTRKTKEDLRRQCRAENKPIFFKPHNRDSEIPAANRRVRGEFNFRPVTLPARVGAFSRSNSKHGTLPERR